MFIFTDSSQPAWPQTSPGCKPLPAILIDIIRKMKKISCAFILLSMLSCKEVKVSEISFKEAQPENINGLSRFPNRLLGNYSNEDKSKELSILPSIIIQTVRYDSKIHTNEIGNELTISGDTLIDNQTKEKYRFRKDGDSLVVNVAFRDTMFALDQNHILKKFKGHYFLNTQVEPKFWEVIKMDLSKGKLSLAGIYDDQQIKNLEKITETKSDTIANANFKPTKKQFKKFLKSNGFEENEVYYKVN